MTCSVDYVSGAVPNDGQVNIGGVSYTPPTGGAFSLYVDATGGSDANPGSFAKPFASLGHALSAAISGQSIGVKVGTLQRSTTALTATTAAVTIGEYGIGAKPILSGGTVVAGPWTSQGSGGTGGTQPTPVQSAKGFVNGGTAPAATLTATPTVGNTLVCFMGNGSGTAVMTLPAGFTANPNAFLSATGADAVTVWGTRVVQAGDGKTWTGSFAVAGNGSIIVVEVHNYGGVDQFNSVRPAQTPWAATGSITPTWQNSLAFSVGTGANGAGSGFVFSQAQAG